MEAAAGALEVDGAGERKEDERKAEERHARWHEAGRRAVAAGKAALRPFRPTVTFGMQTAALVRRGVSEAGRQPGLFVGAAVMQAALLLLALLVRDSGTVEHAANLHEELAAELNPAVTDPLLGLAEWARASGAAVAWIPGGDPNLERMIETLPDEFDDLVVRLDSEEQLNSYITGDDYGFEGLPLIAAAVVLRDGPSTLSGDRSNETMGYRLLANSTGTLRSLPRKGMPDTFQLGEVSENRVLIDAESLRALYFNGVHGLQRHVDSYMAPHAWQYSFRPFPTPAFEQSKRFSDSRGAEFMLVAGWGGIVMIMGAAARHILADKETGFRALLGAMDIHGGAFSLAWFALFAVIAVGGSLLSAAASSLTFTHSSFAFLFMLHLLAALLAVAWTVLLATAFRSQIGTAVILLLAFLSPIPGYGLRDTLRPTSTISGVCSLPASCLVLAYEAIEAAERFGTGLDLDCAARADGKLTVCDGLAVMAAMTLALMLLVALIEWYSGRQPRVLRTLPAAGLRADSLAVHFRGSSGLRTRAVDDFSARLGPGGVLVVLGGPGSGKSALLGTLSGIHPLHGGRLRLPAGGVGYCPQVVSVHPDMTCRDHVDLMLRVRGVRSRDVAAEADELLEAVGLTEKASSGAALLSGGHSRLLHLAMALAGRPGLLLLDSPTAGLDPLGRSRVARLVSEAAAGGQALVVASRSGQDSDSLESATEAVVLTEGRVVARVDTGGAATGKGGRRRRRRRIVYTLELDGVGDDGESAANATARAVAKVAAGAKRVEAVAPGAVAFRWSRMPSGGVERLVRAASSPEWTRRLGVTGFRLGAQPLVRQMAAEAAARAAAASAAATQRLPMLRVVVSETRESLRAGGGRGDRSPTAASRVEASVKLAAAVRAVSVNAAAAAPARAASRNEGNDDGDGGGKNGDPSRAPRRARTETGSRRVPASRTAKSNATSGGAVSAGAECNSYLSEAEARGQLRQPSFLRMVRLLLRARKKRMSRDRASLLWQLLYPLGVTFVVGLLAVGTSRLDSLFTVRDSTTLPFGTPHTVLVNDDAPACAPVASLAAAWPFNNEAVAVEAATPEAMSLELLSRYNNGESRFTAAWFDPAAGCPGNVTLFANSTAPYALTASYNMWSNAVLHNSSGSASALISLEVRSLPLTAEEDLLRDLSVVFWLVLCLAVSPPSFARWAVYERQTGTTSQVLRSGATSKAFWTASLVSDTLIFAVPLSLTTLLAILADEPGDYGDWIGVLMVTGLLYGLAIISAAYLITLRMRSPVAALVIVLVYILAGAAVALIMFGSVVPNDPDAIYGVRLALAVVHPTYAYADGVAALLLSSSEVFGTRASPWTLDNSGAAMMVLACQAAVLFSAVLYYRRLALASATQCCGGDPRVRDASWSEEPEVVRERERVAAGGAKDDALTLVGARKAYRRGGSRCGDLLNVCCGVPAALGALGNRALGRGGGMDAGDERLEQDMLSGGGGGAGSATDGESRVGGGTVSAKVAVKDLTLGVRPGEALAVVGTNGSGKSTVARLLAAEELPTSGEVLVGGKPVTPGCRVGFLPQWNPFSGFLSAREEMVLHAGLRGYPEEECDAAAACMLHELGLVGAEADKPLHFSSPSTQRLAAVGIALVGNPSVVVLDEPTATLDREGKRVVWRAVRRRCHDRCLVVATQDMYECEELGDRVAVMVAGRLRYLGEVENLRAQYSDGYILRVALASHANGSAADARSTVGAFLPSAYPLASHTRRVAFGIPLEPQGEPLRADAVAAAIAGLQERKVIEGFRLSTVSLGDVLLRFGELNDRFRHALNLEGMDSSGDEATSGDDSDGGEEEEDGESNTSDVVAVEVHASDGDDSDAPPVAISI